MKIAQSLFLAAGLLLGGALSAGVKTGATAPGFTLQTPAGEKVSLSDFAGKYVVLEWVNPGCPFVQKFYNVGAMQRFQKEAQEMGAVWITINSTNPEHGDYLDPAASKAYFTSKGVNSIWLLDPTGEVGKLYDAARTPHCYVIDPTGKLVYQGAIDDKRSAKSSDIEGATNYVLAALDASKNGKKLETTETHPYGCTIKY